MRNGGKDNTKTFLKEKTTPLDTFFFLRYNIAETESGKEPKMKKIASFTINHEKLLPGLYVSRRDTRDGVAVTTFDLRFRAPNKEPVMDVPALHTIEHLGATFFRNGEGSEDVVYFGPMGCRTGFYLLLFGEVSAADALDRVLAMCDFILSYEGDIPGASAVECGNYSEQSLPMAKYYVSLYREALLSHGRLVYPE